MKLIELFTKIQEEPLAIKRVTGRSVEFEPTAYGVKQSMDLDNSFTNVRIDTETGEIVDEPSEADEAKIAQNIIQQRTISVQEQPFPADKVIYYIPTNDELERLGIMNARQENLVNDGDFYVLGPNNKPMKISWKNRYVEFDDITRKVELGLERGPAEQARILRIMQRQKTPLDPQLSSESVELEEEKRRLDPKCWKGYKIGNPKTKMKGGVRVNNCVPK